MQVPVLMEYDSTSILLTKKFNDSDKNPKFCDEGKKFGWPPKYFYLF
jgi:hypothetical protein